MAGPLNPVLRCKDFIYNNNGGQNMHLRNCFSYPYTIFPLILLLALLAACAAQDAADQNGGTVDPSIEISTLQTELWDNLTASSIALRFREGLPLGGLDDPSFEGYQKVAATARDCVERIKAIDLDAAVDSQVISGAEWVDAKAIAWDCAIAVESERWFWHFNVLASYSSPLPSLGQIFSNLPLQTAEQRSIYLDLLAQLPAFVTQLQNRVEGQAERGIYLWRANHDTAVALVRTLIAAEDASGPYGIQSQRLDGIELENEQRQALLSRSLDLIHGAVNPALESLAKYLESAAYWENTPENVGAAALPDGEDYYRFATRVSTTMNTTPEEIHQLGLKLVAEMEADMAQLQQKVGYQGSTKSFREELRTNPRFFPKNPEEVGDRLLDAAHRMETVVDQYFSKRPQAPYGVKRLDPALEASQTYGYYQTPTPADEKGYYNYNGSKLDQRSWLNLRAVSLHELVPGHHFHIARQFEDSRLSDYRRNTLHGAFTEGWGSYSSYLGLEAGVYEGDPYSEYGMYILEVFLATRLVVDPGMNLLNWSLEEARTFMREHTLESQTQIASESLRYSADMPGQALAYQMGKLKFLELRQRAEQELGDQFDIRTFHEALLQNGSLPMAVLEESIDRFIAKQKNIAGGDPTN